MKDWLWKFAFYGGQNFEEDVADDGQAARIDVLDGVLGCVPIGILDIEIDDVDGGNTAADEGEMVVAVTGKGSFTKMLA
jgi:hypothetical protein